MGRKKIVWAEEQFRQFEKLCSLQCTEEDICATFNVTDKTLNRLLKEHYGKGFSEVYTKYSAVGKISLRRAQFKAAEKGNPHILIWLGKQYLGQREPEKLQEEKTHDIEDLSEIRKAVFVDGNISDTDT